MVKILIVEDDSALSMGFEYALKKEGYEASCAKNLKEARSCLKSQNIDLILLDVMLPDGSGYDLCKEVRKNSSIPVIFITACEEEANVVLGLDLGGDDYITKPVRIKELISRINAVLRRHKSYGIRQGDEMKRLVSGDLVIEPLKFKAYKSGKVIILTAMEYKLLLLFLENRGNVLSRNTLLEKLWDIEGNFIDGNSLNVYIKRLREKIEGDIKEPLFIETVRGMGYRWKEEVLLIE